MYHLEELEKLAALRDQGIISDEEFQAKRGSCWACRGDERRVGPSNKTVEVWAEPVRIEE